MRPQVESSEIVRALFMKGVLASANSVLDRNTIKLVAQEVRCSALLGVDVSW